MILIANKNLKNNVYNVELKFIDITDTDKEKISDFGEPTINVGGTIKEKGTKPEVFPVMKAKTEKVIEEKLVYEEDGVTPIYEEDGVTQKTEQVEVDKPVLDENGEQILEQVISEDGNPVFEVKEVETEIVVAELGTNLRKFPSEFPVTVSFGVIEFGEKAQEIAEAYIKVVEEEAKNKIGEITLLADTFTGKEEFKLS